MPRKPLEIAITLTFSGIAGVMLGRGFEILSDKYRIEQKKQTSKSDPYETATQIEIQDASGLESLLNKTAQKRVREWGTVLTSESDGHIISVSQIMDPDEAIRQGFSRQMGRTHIYIDTPLARENGYNGVQHYHPPLNLTDNHLPKQLYAVNYYVHVNDRVQVTPGTINFITFNTLKRPEIIGYNLSSTFIPENPEKTRLVKASPAQIMRYLART